MEFEDVSENLEWEARRVAAAFGVKEWIEFFPKASAEDRAHFEGKAKSHWVHWVFIRHDTHLLYIYVGERNDEHNYCSFSNYSFDNHARYQCHPHRDYNRHMARGLYLLGFEDKILFMELAQTLSTREKLELRLSLPREFWLKTWLDEEKK